MATFPDIHGHECYSGHCAGWPEKREVHLRNQLAQANARIAELEGAMGEYCPTCRDAELTRLREENERLKGLLGVNMAPVEVHHGKCSGDVPGVVCLGCEDAIVNILHERIENLRGERMDLLADTAKQAKREALEEAAKSLSVFQTAYTSAMMESYHQLMHDGHEGTVIESAADWILEIGSQCVRFLEALAHPPAPEKPCPDCHGKDGEV